MEGPTLRITNLAGSVMGGALGGQVAFDTGPLHAFEGELDVTDLDLSRFSRLLAPPEEGERDLRGSLEGKARVAGVVGDLDSLKATGYLRVEDGQLWDLPLFLAIFDVFELPERPAFQTCRLEYTLARRKIGVREVR